MKHKKYCIGIIFVIGCTTTIFAQKRWKNNILFRLNSPDWVQTGGPGGGYINDIAIDPSNPSILFAAGSGDGIYKSTDAGDKWILHQFTDAGGAQIIEIDPQNPATLYCDYQNFSKSTDAGLTWQQSTVGFGNDVQVHAFKLDPNNSSVLYMAGVGHHPPQVLVYKSEDGAQSWQNITGNLTSPTGSQASALAVLDDGKIFVGVNDRDLQTWHRGKVFYSEDDGQAWSEVDFGQSEDRFIWSIFANPYDRQEVWISEGPLYNTPIPQPLLYRSSNGGSNWSEIHINVRFDPTQVRVIGASSDGKVFVAGGGQLFYTANSGASFISIDPPTNEMTFVDFTNIAVHPSNSNILYLPLRAGGIAYSENGGVKWILKNDGILNTSVNLLAPDPVDPSIIYAATTSGEGVFRSDDYGESWIWLNGGGIIHPWSDELVVDPIDAHRVWYIADVPIIHKSGDRGTTWDVVHMPNEGNTLNFSSVYAMAPTSNPNIMYAMNNGFGIFKGTRQDENAWEWAFLNLSEIDYTYTLAVEPNNPDVIYSGYNRKPFETQTKIRASSDGGESWYTSLEIDGAEAVTSVVIDPTDVNHIYAASTGNTGGILWKSENKGQTWTRLNDHFNFTTIHAFAIAGGDAATVYAGVWGGGTFKTSNDGATWEKLPGNEAFSAAAIAVDPTDPDILYVADRTEPILHRSDDGGQSWTEHFCAASEYRRLMSVTVDPTNTSCLYVSAMKTAGPGRLGGLFKMEDGIVTDINGILSKTPLNVTVDGSNSDILYTVLHENGVYKSTDGGTTWFEISGPASGLPESGFLNVIVDPNDSDILYLIGGCDVLFSTFESAGLDPDIVNGVYQSTDAGQSWENINRGVLGAASGGVKSLVFYQNNSNILLLGCENSVYLSTDRGASWQTVSGLPYSTLGGIAVSDNTLYAFTNGAGVFTGFINPDYSITWNDEQKAIAKVTFAQILKHPTESNIIYASGYPGGIFKSTDDGVTWHEANFGMVSFPVEDPLRQGYYALALCRSDPRNLYLGLYQRGVYRSTNGGGTWYAVHGKMFDKKITSLVVDKQNSDRVYVGTEDGVYTSNDGGGSWTVMNQELPCTDIRTLHMNDDGELYAGTRGYGLFRWIQNHWESQSTFENWGVIWPMWDDRPMYQYTSLLIHPRDNSRMLIGTFPQGIYKSSDGGMTWRESNIGWTTDGVFCLVSHPLDPEIVYAGTYNGMNRSLDWGEHWEMWDNGWPPEQWAFSIDFDPASPDIMVACSKNGENEGRGRAEFRGTVMKSIDGGANWFEITKGLDQGAEGLNQEFYKIIVDRFDSDTYYLAAQNDGVYISRDAGESWMLWIEGLTNPIPGTNGNNVTNTMTLSADHSILYFGSAGSGVFRRMISPILPVNNLHAEVVDHQIILHWAFDDLRGNFQQYNVYRSITEFTEIDGLLPYSSISNVSQTTYTDGDIEQGTQYYYTVTTVDVSDYENGHIYILGPIVDFGMSITPASLDTGTIGIEYSATLQAQGGTPPYRWEITAGVLPPGVDLDENSGIISGTPTITGSYDFTVKVNDSQTPPFHASQRFTLVIAPTSAVDTPDVPINTLLQNCYPNPFNNEIMIPYQLRTSGSVTIRIYDSMGRKVITLMDQKKQAGFYTTLWNGRTDLDQQVASGTYICEMKTGNYLGKRKILYLK